MDDIKTINLTRRYLDEIEKKSNPPATSTANEKVQELEKIFFKPTYIFAKLSRTQDHAPVIALYRFGDKHSQGPFIFVFTQLTALKQFLERNPTSTTSLRYLSLPTNKILDLIVGDYALCLVLSDNKSYYFSRSELVTLYQQYWHNTLRPKQENVTTHSSQHHVLLSPY